MEYEGELLRSVFKMGKKKVEHVVFMVKKTIDFFRSIKHEGCFDNEKSSI